jgi:hypothetical protein
MVVVVVVGCVAAICSTVCGSSRSLDMLGLVHQCAFLARKMCCVDCAAICFRFFWGWMLSFFGTLRIVSVSNIVFPISPRVPISIQCKLTSQPGRKSLICWSSASYRASFRMFAARIPSSCGTVSSTAMTHILFSSVLYINTIRSGRYLQSGRIQKGKTW